MWKISLLWKKLWRNLIFSLQPEGVYIMDMRRSGVEIKKICACGVNLQVMERHGYYYVKG